MIICGQVILWQLLLNISATDYFSLIAIKVLIFPTMSMCLTISWVGLSYTDQEEAFGLLQLPDTKALDNVQCQQGCAAEVLLNNCQLHWPTLQWSSQHYFCMECCSSSDEKKASHFPHFHCLVHSLNLFVHDVTKRCELLLNCMEFILQLLQLIRFLPKILNHFERMHKGKGLLMLLENFNTYFSLNPVYLIFRGAVFHNLSGKECYRWKSKQIYSVPQSVLQLTANWHCINLIPLEHFTIRDSLMDEPVLPH